jgi:hypothetical protein
VTDLPHYRRLVSIAHTAIAPKLCDELADPQKLSKCSTLYTLAPRNALLAILKLSNPFSMIESMISLFLVRPLGAKNLMQRMMSIVAELSKSEKLLGEAQKILNNKRVIPVLQSWVSRFYEPIDSGLDLYEDPEVVIRQSDSRDLILSAMIADLRKNLTENPPPTTNHNNNNNNNNNNSFFSPRMRAMFSAGTSSPHPNRDLAEVIEYLERSVREGKTEVENVFRVLYYEMRLKEKRTFVDLFGDDQIIQMVKTFSPVFCQALVLMHQSAVYQIIIFQFGKN